MTDKVHKGMYYLDLKTLLRASRFGCNTTKQIARKKLYILIRDDFKCVKCSRKRYLTIDHIDGKPNQTSINSGTFKPKICQTLCVDCHKEKNKANDSKNKRRNT